MKRPLVLAAVCFAFGCALSQAAPQSGALGIAAAGVTLAAAALLGNPRRRQTLLLVALFFAAGLLSTGARTALSPRFDFPDPYWKTGETLGRVLEAPVFWPGTDYAQLLVDTQEGVALLRWSDPVEPVFPGQEVRFRGDGTTLLGNVNFALSGPEDYYRVLGVTHAVSLSGNALRVESTPSLSIAYWLGRLRAWQGELFTRACPPDVLPFVFAVWLGQRDRLAPGDSRAYLETGTTHMLSVSGLHVAIVYFSLEFLLSAFIRRERARALLILVAVFAFALLAGARPSTLRAAFVIAMYLSARLVRREPDPPTALAVSALLLLVWNPLLLYDVGALLSFASVASLLCYADPMTQFLRRRLRLPERLAAPLAACLAVQVLTLPMTVSWFHVVSFSSPLANLIAVPLLDLVLWGCVAVVLAGALLPGTAPLFGHALWLPVAGIDWTVSSLARMDVLSQPMPSPTLPALVCYYLAVLLPLMLRRAAPTGDALPTPVSPLLAPRYGITAMALFLAASVLLWRPSPPTAQVDVLDVGHGDAAVVFAPEGGVVLIDGGDRSEYRDYGESVVVPFLLAHGVSRIDAIISTHPDRDHIGGLFTVLRTFPVGRVYLSAKASGKPLESGLITLCRERGIEVERLGAGDQLDTGGARFEVLHPPADGKVEASVNNTSIVARLSWQPPGAPPFSMLFPGDIEASAEEAVATQSPRATVLRVPHHGSFTSSSAPFLEAVQPGLAIVSTRTTARRDAMGPGVEQRFVDRAIPIYRTDTHGGLRITGSPPRLLSARELRGWTE
jgi:competence protein ComEC